MSNRNSFALIEKMIDGSVEVDMKYLSAMAEIYPDNKAIQDKYKTEMKRVKRESEISEEEEKLLEELKERQKKKSNRVSYIEGRSLKQNLVISDKEHELRNKIEEKILEIFVMKYEKYRSSIVNTSGNFRDTRELNFDFMAVITKEIIDVINESSSKDFWSLLSLQVKLSMLDNVGDRIISDHTKDTISRKRFLSLMKANMLTNLFPNETSTLKTPDTPKIKSVLTEEMNQEVVNIKNQRAELNLIHNELKAKELDLAKK